MRVRQRCFFYRKKDFIGQKIPLFIKELKVLLKLTKSITIIFLFNQYRNKKSNKIKPKTIKIYKIKYRQYLQFD
ncbi:hypothetical protein DVY91_00860 [Enterococcus faecalis]|nr:hypothetical protein CG806_09700 [Enterococcus faecalis ARO1/DG]PQC96055.1 hypothetical protein CUN39_10340 [Enterococcus faecalis]PQF51001.1 hypothetical protein CUS71_02125 [Enterococcus faecalis]TKL71965.1 hypothetical protein DVW13_02580 [Enterococcus faecalis]TKM54802.1 hypothetical protein DVW59_00860 [Enterococcus faecalis]